MDRERVDRTLDLIDGATATWGADAMRWRPPEADKPTEGKVLNWLDLYEGCLALAGESVRQSPARTPTPPGRIVLDEGPYYLDHSTMVSVVRSLDYRDMLRIGDGREDRAIQQPRPSTAVTRTALHGEWEVAVLAQGLLAGVPAERVEAAWQSIVLWAYAVGYTLPSAVVALAGAMQAMPPAASLPPDAPTNPIERARAARSNHGPARTPRTPQKINPKGRRR